MVNKLIPYKEFMRNTLWFMDYILDYIYMFPFKFKKLGRVRKILMVELKFIGDIIVTTPTIRAVKQAFPLAKIDILVSQGMEDTLYGNPNISEILPFNYNYDEWARKLKGGYDLAIILHNGTIKVSTMLLKAKIPYRIGCTKVGFLESKGFFLHKKTKPTYQIKHKVDDNLDVIKTIGIYPRNKNLEIYSDLKTELEMKKKLQSHYCAILNSSRHAENKEWLPERFAELAQFLQNNGYEIVLTGSKQDYEKNENLKKLSTVFMYNFAGTSIKEFFAIIKNAEFVISIDSSAMHIAAGFNVPVIALFGAGTPKIWRPYSKNSIVVFKDQVHTSCMKPKCYLKGDRHMECMKAIKTDDVIDAIRRIKENRELVIERAKRVSEKRA